MIQQLLSDLAQWLPLGYAFGAGMVSAVNPCGFLMLPSYIAYYLGTEQGNPQRSSLPWRGLQGALLALAITIGFVVLFSIIGLVVTLGGRALLGMVPKAGVGVGVALVGLGLWLLLRKSYIGIAAASRVAAPFKRSISAAFVFGIAYAVASLSCTLPIFLVVVGSALATQDVARASLQFVSYSLGMGFLLAVVITSAAFFRGALDRYLRGVMPYVHEISAVFLIGAGGYLIYYWIRYGAVLQKQPV